jgi:hypothetical protein
MARSVSLPLPPLPPPTSPVGGEATTLPATSVPPQQVWGTLAPPERARLRQTLVALLQEVARVRDAPR